MVILLLVWVYIMIGSIISFSLLHKNMDVILNVPILMFILLDVIFTIGWPYFLYTIIIDWLNLRK